MPSLRLSLAGLSLFVLAGCAEPNPTEIWDVRAIPAVCDNGSSIYYCASYDVVDTNEHVTTYEGVGGFHPQWGHSYRIEVERSEVADPPLDGSTIRYDLVEVLSDEVEPGLEFTLALLSDWVSVDDEGGHLQGFEYPFTCTPEQCTELAALLADQATNQDLEATFRLGPATQLFPAELVGF